MRPVLGLVVPHIVVSQHAQHDQPGQRVVVQGAPRADVEIGFTHRLGFLGQPRREEGAVQGEVLGGVIQRDPGQIALDRRQRETQPLQVTDEFESGHVALVIQAQPTAYRRWWDQTHPGVEPDRPHADPGAVGQLRNGELIGHKRPFPG